MAKSYLTYKTEDGFDDGLAMGLSFLYDILDKFEPVDHNILAKAQYYARQRHIEEYNKMLKQYKVEDKESERL